MNASSSVPACRTTINSTSGSAPVDYAVRIYECSAQWPVDERYNLVAQVRKAATSVPLNMAEGTGCATNAEFARFLGFAYRSLKEIVTCLELCQRLYRALPLPDVAPLIDEGHQISRMTHALIERLAPRGDAPRS